MIYGCEIIEKYFPSLSPSQKDHFSQLGALYSDWNGKINLISRKDIDHIYLHHVLHSLSIAKAISFVPGTKVLDAGTGGGFPGIPLAIIFPQVQFTLLDSVAKKVKVVNAVANALQLNNVETQLCRVEEITEQFDFILSRAVTTLSAFYEWVIKLIRHGERNTLPNGILYLKGGELEEEVKQLNQPVMIFELSSYFSEPFFKAKKLVYVKAFS